jgi:hypothetical protein
MGKGLLLIHRRARFLINATKPGATPRAEEQAEATDLKYR